MKVSPRDETHGPHDVAALYCSRCGKELEDAPLGAHWERLAEHLADRLIELWHANDFPLRVPSLAEWMGLTDEQYAAWVECRYEDVIAK